MPTKKKPAPATKDTLAASATAVRKKPRKRKTKVAASLVHPDRAYGNRRR